MKKIAHLIVLFVLLVCFVACNESQFEKASTSAAEATTNGSMLNVNYQPKEKNGK